MYWCWNKSIEDEISNYIRVDVEISNVCPVSVWTQRLVTCLPAAGWWLVARQANFSRVAWQPAVCFMLITKLTIIIDTTRNWKYLKKVDLVWCTLPSRQSGWSGWGRIMKGLLPECCLCNEEARRTNNGLTPALSAPCMASYLTCVTRYLMYSDISRQRPSVSGAVCWL